MVCYGIFHKNGSNKKEQRSDQKWLKRGFPGGLEVKNPLANAGYTGSPDWGRFTYTTHRHYWACALEPRGHCWAHPPQPLKHVLPKAWALPQEKPPQWEACTTQLEEVHVPQWRPTQAKIKYLHTLQTFFLRLINDGLWILWVQPSNLVKTFYHLENFIF